ncbi:L,D-transpeptidase [Ciceribacter ferrooxidans]|uniref:L,D-transpeptidase n=1 Tax=Ciceribacter ferrooxidans TaxID=2509717 RepID=A0A4Q2T1B5_9HYPH|nr:L,D-transpeptidase [Ciceribacter ferrooxidans]RYC12426.1 L,D-transpeptidase [Ciceribacter ferrooxidans]
MWKAGLVVATLAAGSAAWTAAEAQEGFDPYRSDTLLVTPEGDILGYTPEEGEVVVSRDRMGRRVLIDRRGRVIATEVRADTYFPRRHPGSGEPVYEDFGAPAPGFEDDGVVTGAIPERGTVDRAPLDQPLPDMPSGGPDMPPPVDQAPQTIVTPDIPVKSNLSQLEITALQVFLDREGTSPGVIDGKMGQNVNKALVAWQEMTGETIDPNNAEDILERLRMSGGMAVTSYTITPGDAAGPYVASIPEDYSLKAQLPSLAYTSTVEMLAEKFHMDENYLRALNPGVDFTIPGTIIKVVEPGKPKTGKVARIVADKGKKQVFAYGEDGSLLAAYPASIGSADTPSPSGIVTVERVALNPGYTYNPKINFQQGSNNKVLAIPPGPNGPVGTVWMALSKPTYGIHGTPEPAKIGRTQSHGCIRLTNWDATELAKMVSPGVTVEFVD